MKSATTPLPSAASQAAHSCSVLAAAGVLGDFWTLGVVRCVVYGMRRYGEFQQELGVATNVLADRLGRLVDSGVLHRVEYQQHPPRFEYVLTDVGHQLVPLVLMLKAWGDHNLQPAGPYTAVRHETCRSPLEITLRCPDCGAATQLHEIATDQLRPLPTG